MFLKQNYNLLAIFTGAFISLSAPVVVFAATAAIEPATVSTAVGKTFTVSVVFDSTQSFNAGEGTVSYDASKLTLTAVSKGSSFTIWQTEPRTGNPVTFSGGATSVLSGKQTIAKMTFKAKSVGSAEIKFDKASIISVDTSADIADVKNAAMVSIAAGAPLESEPTAPTQLAEPEVRGGGDLPEAPYITSKTNPKIDEYSSGETVKFEWELPSDVTVVAVDFDTSSSTIPKTKYEPAIADRDYHQMTEGVNFVHVRFKNSAGWGKVAHRQFLFDKTPPLPFDVLASTTPQSNLAMLSFSATDTLSGILRYDYILDGGTAKPIQLVEMKSGNYPVSGLANGSHGIKIVAYDKAGNKTEAVTAITIDAPVKSDLGADEKANAGGSAWATVLAALLALATGLLAGMLWKERKAFRDEKFIAKREADETRDRVATVFSALREEVRDRLGELSDKPNPSALDREVAKRMNDALDLSEELIEKEVEDVRKLLSAH